MASHIGIPFNEIAAIQNLAHALYSARMHIIVVRQSYMVGELAMSVIKATGRQHVSARSDENRPRSRAWEFTVLQMQTGRNLNYD